MKNKINTERTVETICYGKRRKWKNREDAIKFFLNCLISSDGSEGSRYIKILNELVKGENICIDD